MNDEPFFAFITGKEKESDTAAAEAPDTGSAGADGMISAPPAFSAGAAATAAPAAELLPSDAPLSPGRNDGAENDASHHSAALAAAMAAAAALSAPRASSTQPERTSSTALSPPLPFSANRASSPALSIDSTDAALNASHARMDAALSAALLARQMADSGDTQMQVDSTIQQFSPSTAQMNTDINAHGASGEIEMTRRDNIEEAHKYALNHWEYENNAEERCRIAGRSFKLIESAAKLSVRTGMGVFVGLAHLDQGKHTTQETLFVSPSLCQRDRPTLRKMGLDMMATFKDATDTYRLSQRTEAAMAIRDSKARIAQIDTMKLQMKELRAELEREKAKNQVQSNPGTTTAPPSASSPIADATASTSGPSSHSQAAIRSEHP
ncbi:hypothetical protein CF326_g6402 [Tilletia indica]|nr:hypothetical protein CF326_g6402 [Tilletia indica]